MPYHAVKISTLKDLSHRKWHVLRWLSGFYTRRAVPHKCSRQIDVMFTVVTCLLIFYNMACCGHWSPSPACTTSFSLSSLGCISHTSQTWPQSKFNCSTQVLFSHCTCVALYLMQCKHIIASRRKEWASECSTELQFSALQRLLDFTAPGTDNCFGRCVC